jgi:hypothetical protein
MFCAICAWFYDIDGSLCMFLYGYDHGSQNRPIPSWLGRVGPELVDTEMSFNRFLWLAVFLKENRQNRPSHG